MDNEKITPDDKFISSHIFDSDFTHVVRKTWTYSIEMEQGDIYVTWRPFKLCSISNFLQKPLGTYDLRGELLSVRTKKRGNDLMKLSESIVDLKEVTAEDTYSQNTECIRQFYSELLNDFKPWLQAVTKIELNNKISIRGSTYTDTDFLLCHNDQVEDRRIAFILYLSKNWQKKYGGSLDLFESKDNIPTKICKSFVPKYNSLVFFEVSNDSFHQVSEILAKVSRFSVNGWFHGPEKHKPLFTVPRPERLLNTFAPENDDIKLSTFIPNTRIANDTFIQLINKTIELFSFCGIKRFIKDDIYAKLLQEVTSSNIMWDNVGPPDERNYEVACRNTLPELLQKFYNMFKSEVFCRLLRCYSELDLVKNGKNNPKITIELQRWKQGFYTVLHDGQLKRTNNDKIDSTVDEPENSCAESSECYTVKEMMDDIVGQASVSSKIVSNIISSTSSRNYSKPGKRDLINYDDDDDADDDADNDKDDYDDYENELKKARLSDEKDVTSDPESESQSGTFDVVIYFHADRAPENTTLNYVDPETEDGVFLTLPIADNCLFMVYRQDGIIRHNEYVNHYCKGNFYSLVCSYREK